MQPVCSTSSGSTQCSDGLGDKPRGPETSQPAKYPSQMPQKPPETPFNPPGTPINPPETLIIPPETPITPPESPITPSESPITPSEMLQKCPSQNGTLPQEPLRRLLSQIHTRFVAQCHPADFASVMGTGISANILYNFPFPSRALQIIALVVGMLAACIFVFLLATHVAGMVRNPALVVRMHRDPAYAPFLGAFVMGYTSLVMFLHAVAGRAHAVGVWGLFWVVCAGSVYTALITLYCSSIQQPAGRGPDASGTSLSMTLLLPVVTLTVAASCGQLVAPDLPSVSMQVTTMVVALVMWSVAMCVAFLIVAVNFWRLFVHHTPAAGSVLTLFLPIGYAGQGAFGILLFGRNCVALIMSHAHSSSPYTAFLQHHMPGTAYMPMLASAIFVVCSMFALVSISFGFFLTAVALMAVLSKIPPFCRHPDPAFACAPAHGWRRPFRGLLRFHRGFWAMTFPLGTLALANAELYRTFPGLAAFRYIAVLYAGALFSVVLGCLVGAAYRFGGMVRAARRPDSCIV